MTATTTDGRREREARPSRGPCSVETLAVAIRSRPVWHAVCKRACKRPLPTDPLVRSATVAASLVAARVPAMRIRFGLVVLLVR